MRVIGPRTRWVGTCNSHPKPMTWHFYRRIYLKETFSFVKERQFRSGDAVTSVSCDWSRHSHRSLIPEKFDLKISRSMKTPWQEYSGVACSYTSTPSLRIRDVIWAEWLKEINYLNKTVFVKARITFRRIMPFRKSYHMQCSERSELIPPFPFVLY